MVNFKRFRAGINDKYLVTRVRTLRYNNDSLGYERKSHDMDMTG